MFPSQEIVVAAQGLSGLFDLPGLTIIFEMGEIGLDLLLGEAFGRRQSKIVIAISNLADIIRNMLRIQWLVGYLKGR